jgi:hypothetical protein
MLGFLNNISADHTITSNKNKLTGKLQCLQKNVKYNKIEVETPKRFPFSPGSHEFRTPSSFHIVKTVIT